MPDAFWHDVFLAGHPGAAAIWGPIVGPLVAVVSFVCSIGNVPLAVVLWTGGISFGGVVAFLFADLIILPILNIYRRYYGWRMAALLAGVLYLTAAVAGYVVELVFGGLGWIPSPRHRAPARRGHLLELHDLAQHRVPGARPRRWSSGSCAPAAVRCSR